MTDTTNSNKFAGKLFLVSIQDPSDDTGMTWKPVAGLRATGGNVSDTFFDVTSKDNLPWAQSIPGGVRKMTISMGGVFEDAASLAYLNWKVLSSAEGGVIMPFKLSSENGDVFVGPYAIKSLDRSGPHTAEETWTMALESAGNITWTAPIPTLISCLPATWVHSATQAVSLKGSKFMLGATLTVAGTDCPCVVVDDKTITATIPIQTGAGACALVVTNPDGTATSPVSVTLT